MKTRSGRLEVFYSARGIPTYSVELWHDGLKKHRLIRGAEKAVVRRKAEIQGDDWEEKWVYVEACEKERLDKNNQRKEQEFNNGLASSRTEEALRELRRLDNILNQTLEVNDAINWENLKDRSEFAERKPLKPKLPKKPQSQSLPKEPKLSDPAYQPRLGFLDKLISSRKDRLIAENNARFEADRRIWQKEVRSIEEKTAAAEKAFDEAIASLEEKHEDNLRAWNTGRTEFIGHQEASNEAIEKQRAEYSTSSPDAIIDYCDMVLAASSYPDYFPKEFDLDYIRETKTLIVDYLMPAPEEIPTLKGVKYIASEA